MNLYIDASGQPIRSTGGSDKQYFVLAGVGFDYNSPSAETDCFDILSSLLKKYKRPEFKFSNDNHKIRVEVLDKIKNIDYKFGTIAFWNEPGKLENIGIRKPNDQYKMGLQSIIESLLPSFPYPYLIIDEDVPEKFVGSILRYLNVSIKMKIERNRIQGYQVLSSHRQFGLQLADYMAGAVRCARFSTSKKEKRQGKQYMSLIEEHEVAKRSWNQPSHNL